MRTKIAFPGIKNSQKIRVMVAGVGFYTRIKDITNICTSTHRAAVESALLSLSSAIVTGRQISGFGSTIVVYDHKMSPTRVDVQVDLVDED